MEEAESREKRVAFPKFASFKPRLVTTSSTTSAQKKHEGVEPETRHLIQEHKQRRRPRQHGGHRSRREQPPYKHNETPCLVKDPEVKIHMLTDNVDNVDLSSDLFAVDKDGDVHNLTYGTIHRYSIPRYRRSGYGNVLGATNNLKIDRETSDGSKLRLSVSHAESKKRDKNILSVLRRQGPRILRIHPENAGLDADIADELDFIELSSRARRKRRRVLDGQAVHETASSDDDRDNRSHYRSIEGKAKDTRDLESDFDSISATSDFEANGRLALKSDRRRLAQLARKTEANPKDVHAWIDLANQQDYVLGLGSDNPSRDATNAERRGLADVKLSIYEKAISKVGRQPARELLLLAMMDEATKLWDTKKLANKWREVLQENSNLIDLWIRYIGFQQTSFITFTFEQCRSIYSDCMSILATSPPTSERTCIQVYVFLRMTVLMRESGFSEQATALWQSMLEFNFFRPADKDNNLAERMSSFGSFWESEVARIGEEHATGWNNSPGTGMNPLVDSPAGALSEVHLFESWNEVEHGRIRCSLLPARTLDEVTEDDPYRVILFADIEEYIFDCSDQIGQEILLNAFLLFCRLAPLPAIEHEIQAKITSWWRDPFLRNELLQDYKTISEAWFPENLSTEAGKLSLLTRTEDEDGRRANTTQTNLFPMPYFQIETGSLFAQYGHQANLWGSEFLQQDSFLSHKWVQTCLQQLLGACPSNDRLAELVLALTSHTNPAEGRKQAKSLLRKRQSHILLYNAYALAECRNGDFLAAERAWSMALSMNKTLPLEQQTFSILLWHSWIWEVLGEGQPEKALRLLFASSDENPGAETFAKVNEALLPYSPAEMLRAQNYLSSGQQSMRSSQHTRQALAFTDCRALLAYLTAQCRPDAALDVYRKSLTTNSTSPSPTPILTELIHQARARFLWYHVTTVHSYKPSLVRSELMESISLFPSNTVFLTLYAWNEARFRIEDRVRAVTRSLTAGTHGQDSLIGHAFNIYTELHRGVAAGSTIHSARAAFEKAAESPVGRCNVTLWRLFLLFEIKVGENARAKDVFYRGIRSCPWAKQFYMLAFTQLRHLMDFEELQKVYRVMVEKELRIHVDLEEAFERRAERTEARAAGLGEGQMAISLPGDESTPE